MAGEHQPARPLGDLLTVGPGAVEQVHLHQALPVEHGHGLDDGEVDRIVQIEAQHLPLGLHDPDDPVALATNADALTQGACIAEQLVPHLAAQYHEGAGVTGVVRRQEAAQGGVHLPHLGHGRADAEDHGAAAAPAGFDGGVALNHGHHGLDLG